MFRRSSFLVSIRMLGSKWWRKCPTITQALSTRSLIVLRETTGFVFFWCEFYSFGSFLLVHSYILGQRWHRVNCACFLSVFSLCDHQSKNTLCLYYPYIYICSIVDFEHFLYLELLQTTLCVCVFHLLITSSLLWKTNWFYCYEMRVGRWNLKNF